MIDNRITLEDALDFALDRLASGKSLQSIASDYPGHETELAGLLQVAGSVATLQETAEPSPIALATGRRLMLESAARRREGGVTMLVSMIKGLFRWRIAPAVRAHPAISLVMAAMLLGTTAGGGAIAAASESLPDSPFYRVKLATEQVQLALTSDTRSQESLRLAFEERREAERRTMEGRGLVAGDVTGTPTATGTARPSVTWTATGTPKVEHTRVPSGTVSRTPEVEETRVPGSRPSETPDGDDRCDDVTPVPGTSPAPRCTEKPQPSRTPRATETPDGDDDPDTTPVAGLTRTPRPEDDHKTETPEPTRTARPSVTPRPSETPHPSRTPQHTGTATPTRKPLPSRTPTGGTDH